MTQARRRFDTRPFRERLADVSLEGGYDEVNARLHEAGLGDGLPLVPPTDERIAAILAGGGVPAYSQFPMLAPGRVPPTGWDLAANAVLAGCAPEHLAVVAATVEAVADPDFNLTGIQATTGAATPLVIVGGPVVARIGMNAGANSLGQGSRANATIGRALRLVLQNVGLAVPGLSDMATHGQPGKYSWCVAENEAESPWPPLRVALGLPAAASAVTVVGAVGNVEVVLPATSPEDLAHTLAGSMTIEGNAGGEGTFGGGEALVLLPPESAAFLDSHGWDRRRLQRELFARAGVSYEELTPAIVERAIVRRRELGLPDEGVLRVARTPEDVLIVVTGGVGTKATFVPTWPGGTRAITVTLRST
ncbi:MAG: hypothetical protein F4Z25_05420 [Chloroflexi bacterium]|nr:hypothetical protein [Chloroflexota bacterium]